MRLQIVILSFLLIAGCKDHDPQLNKVLIYGHGGMGFDGVNAQHAPNSVSSIKDALDAYGLDGVELDIRFTREGEMLVYHDQFLETSTQCKGKISSMNIDDIGECYYRKQFKNKYVDRVITIDSLIKMVNTEYQDSYISLDIQGFDIPYTLDSISEIFYNKLLDFDARERISVECRDGNFLFFLKRRDANQLCYLVSDIDTVGVRDVNGFGLDGIVGSFEIRDSELEQELADSSKTIILYGQKLPNDYIRYDYTNIDGVQVDNPILALKYFRNQ
jgi:glycerophosphoryl diester phosphodiesterase